MLLQKLKEKFKIALLLNLCKVVLNLANIDYAFKHSNKAFNNKSYFSHSHTTYRRVWIRTEIQN